MAWASLKAPVPAYPAGPAAGCIPGRMAWASLKDQAVALHHNSMAEYPGPHGLGLIEGLMTSNKPTFDPDVSRAAWPGPH